MDSFKLPEELETRLDNLSLRTHRTKTFYVKQALEGEVADLEDIYISLDRTMKPDREFYTSEEALKLLD